MGALCLLLWHCLLTHSGSGELRGAYYTAFRESELKSEVLPRDVIYVLEHLSRTRERIYIPGKCWNSLIANKSPSKLPPSTYRAMADQILDRLTAGNMFDVRGVVAVVTGGGTVRTCNAANAVAEYNGVRRALA